MELVKQLITELGVTSEQAFGGAGAIFCIAQQRMSADAFVQIADCVPAVSDLTGKAPRFDAASGGGFLGWLSKLFGGLGSLRPLARVFRQLGLSESDVGSFVSVILDYVKQQGGGLAEAALRKALS